MIQEIDSKREKKDIDVQKKIENRESSGQENKNYVTEQKRKKSEIYIGSKKLL